MKLAIGTAQFGMSYGINNSAGKVSQGAIKQILNYAASVGISSIDTAIAYGDSEKSLGRAGVENFDVISKLPPIPENCTNVAKWILHEVKGSLSRLGVRSIYGFMLHRPDQLYGPMGNKILASLMDLKSAGLVRKIGVSVYDPSELDRFFSLLDFDIVQCPYNLMDRRLVSSGWLDKLNMSGVEVHIRSSFLQGLLLMERNVIPSKFEKWKNYWDKWDEWVRDNNVTRLRGCLSYCLSCEGVDKVVVGVDKVSQLEEIVASANSKVINSLPELSCSDPNLINPANW
jgi:aryl-alcohol dehydrogenase-like predicted oxidoreductase